MAQLKPKFHKNGHFPNFADFYKYGFVGILQEWIEDGMKEEPEIIIKKLNNIIEGDFKKALEKMQK